MDELIDRHTSELKPSQQDAEEVMQNLMDEGWTVYHEWAPLLGQAGYCCVRTITHPDGSETRHAHSIRWNKFHIPLTPVVMDCLYKTMLFSFLLRHSTHEYFECFEYEEGDIGLVCYCKAAHGWSEILRISDQLDHDLDEVCQEILGELMSNN